MPGQRPAGVVAGRRLVQVQSLYARACLQRQAAADAIAVEHRVEERKIDVELAMARRLRGVRPVDCARFSKVKRSEGVDESAEGD
jgi:hypothetical protein